MCEPGTPGVVGSGSSTKKGGGGRLSTHLLYVDWVNIYTVNVGISSAASQLNSENASSQVHKDSFLLI